MVSKSGCVGWIKKRTHLEKTLLSLSSILILTLVLMILFGIAYHGKKSDTVEEAEEECWSKECIQTAGEMISFMNTSADSCMEFYSFACGKYGFSPGQTDSVATRATHALYYSLDRIMNSTDASDVSGFDSVRNLYSTCLQFGHYQKSPNQMREYVIKLFKEMGVGFWPIIDSLYDDSEFSLEGTLANLALLNVGVVFKMEVIPDSSISGHYLIKITPGGPLESGRSPVEIRGDAFLSSSMLTSFLMLGASAVSTDVNDILSVDSSFAAIEQDKETTCDDVTLLTPQEAIAEMNRVMPEIDWTKVSEEIQKTTGIVRNFAVELHCKQKIRDYAAHLNDFTIRSETNYLGWRFFSKFVEHIIPAFMKSGSGYASAPSRNKECSDLVERIAAPILSDALGRQWMDEERQHKLEKMSKSVLRATEHLVDKAPWLTSAQKSRLRQQVSLMEIRYPNEPAVKSKNSLIDIPGVDVSNYTAVVMELEKQWGFQKLKKLNSNLRTLSESWAPVLSGKQNIPSQDSKVYIYFDNIIDPYLRLHVSDWVNYGALGVVIAREISRVLLSLKVDSVDFWTLWSKKNHSLCLAIANDNRAGIESWFLTNLHKANFHKELFMDMSSIEIALQAVTLENAEKSPRLPAIDFDQEKMFFISYAQTKCDALTSQSSSRARLDAEVVGFKRFQEIFSCSSFPSCPVWS